MIHESVSFIQEHFSYIIGCNTLFALKMHCHDLVVVRYLMFNIQTSYKSDYKL